MDERHDILELARFLTELSVIDYFFVIHRPSSVALAALMNSMDEIPSVSQQARDEFMAEIAKISSLDPKKQDIHDCQNRLQLLYAQGGYARPTTAPESRTESISPVCVTYGCTPPPQRSERAPVESAKSS